MSQSIVETLQEQLELYRCALDEHKECTALVDASARILLINEAYEQILGVRSEDVIGKPVTEVIENTRLDVVLSTGVAEIGQIQRIGEQITGRIGGNITGADLRLTARDGRLTGRIGGDIVGKDCDLQVDGVPYLVAAALAAMVYYQLHLDSSNAAAGS